MNTAWSVYSGGRLNDEIAAKASFTITKDDALDPILLPTVQVKHSFEKKLGWLLSSLDRHKSTEHRLNISVKSAVVGEYDNRDVELTVEVTEEESDSMLWYFMLRSPEANISTDSLHEIAVLIIDRLCPWQVNQRRKAYL